LQFNPAMLFAIGLVSTFITGGLTGIILGDSTLDINMILISLLLIFIWLWVYLRCTVCLQEIPLVSVCLEECLIKFRLYSFLGYCYMCLWSVFQCILSV
jgi:hypothetical protein